MVRPKDGLSIVQGDRECDLSEKTVYELLLDSQRRFPDKIAVVFCHQNIRWSYSEFLEKVELMAAALLALGVRKGDRVGIWSPNRVEWILTQFGTAAIGAILVTLNPAYRIHELEFSLNKVGCSIVIAARTFKSSKYIDMICTLAPEIRHSTNRIPLACRRLQSLRYLVAMEEHEGSASLPGNKPSGIIEFWDLLTMGRSYLYEKLGGTGGIRALAAKNTCFEPINIQFTSGTTGSPKSATLSHRNIVNNAQFVAQALKMTADEAICVPVPLYHCFGLVMSVLVSVMFGAKLVFPGEGFDAQQTLAAVEKERCTVLQGVPSMFTMELGHSDKYDLRSLRTGIMAGSPCPVETMKRVMDKMHLTDITIAYGMTETSPVSFQTAATDPVEKRTQTVGRCRPHIDAKLVGDDGKPVKIGEIGEIWVKGYCTMLGYWGEPKSRCGIKDGWMATGDLGTLDADGYLYIVGRLKDMVIRGGENIYPREVEEFIFQHPKVQTVQVFGVPDATYGEELCAWIILKDNEQSTPQEIRQFCKDQISHFKIPKYIKFVHDLPMTVSGKFQKHIMRESMANELNSSTNDQHQQPALVPRSKY